MLFLKNKKEASNYKAEDVTMIKNFVVFIIAILAFTAFLWIFWPDRALEDADKAYSRGFEAFKDSLFDDAERSFEKAYTLNPKLTYAAYIVGYLNLYPEVKDYLKAREFLELVLEDIPQTVNKNYLFNHVGTTYLMSAITAKSQESPYDNDLRTARYYFLKALEYDKNDITYNNIGRAYIESWSERQIDSSIIFFDKALELKQKPVYRYNKAIAYERLGHFYSSLVKVQDSDRNYRKKAFENFSKALYLHKTNQVEYKRSLEKAKLIEEYYLKRADFNEFK